MSLELNAATEYLHSRGWVYDSSQEAEQFHNALQNLAIDGLVQLVARAKQHGQHGAGMALYQKWIALNTGRSPHLCLAWFNLGTELSSKGDNANAEICYRNALALKADFHQAALNLGLIYENRGQPDTALGVWNQVLQSDEARTTLLNHQGRLLENLGRYDEAETALFHSLLTVANQPDAIQHWTHLRQKQCKWPALGNGIPSLSLEQIVINAGPLSSLVLIDDIGVQARGVAEWVARKIPYHGKYLCPPEGYRHDKIRIGYLSSDYAAHPITYLMAELLKLHDREAFEVFGYCATPLDAKQSDNSPARRRIIAHFDHFHIITPLSDEQAARLIREHEIDILIDLNGITQGARLGVLRWRPAPVQVTYLGYVGPIPFQELDYMICDSFTVPQESERLYHPKPLRMPGVYQVNDRELPVGRSRSRAEWGVPDDKFIYCCFSNSYKVTEPIFNAWMEILRKTEGSVLWLLDDNPYARKNQEAWAQKAGLEPDRLFFGKRLAAEDYLARMRAADVFLDTNPYNSGATASDALRVGLPLVTLTGQCFSARMAGSLLRAVGLEQLATTTMADYIQTAIQLRTDADRHQAVRSHLENGAWSKTLGDTPTFARNLEKLYSAIVKRPPLNEHMALNEHIP